jgi:hypothetical protein
MEHTCDTDCPLTVSRPLPLSLPLPLFGCVWLCVAVWLCGNSGPGDHDGRAQPNFPDGGGVILVNIPGVSSGVVTATARGNVPLPLCHVATLTPTFFSHCHLATATCVF